MGGGWALEIEALLGPVKWHRAIRRVPFGAQKSRDFQGKEEPNFSNLCQTLTDWQLEKSSRTVPKSDLFIPKNLRRLVHNSYIHVSVSDFYIFQDRSRIHECGNWETL